MRTTWVRRLISSFDALQHVGRFEMLMVLPRQPVKGQGLVDVVFDPAGEL
jgi:hypothetical protein